MGTAPEWLSLDSEETIVWTGSPRLRRIASEVVTFFFWSIAAFAAVFVVTRVLNLALPVPDRAAWGVAVLWTLLQAINPVRGYLRTKHTHYVLTDKNVYKRTGVWSENVTRIGIDKIQNTRLNKDLFGNVFDYGTVSLSTAGGSGTEMAIEDLDDPDELRSALRTELSEAADRDRGEPERGHDGIDPDTIRNLVDEGTKLRETAERIERRLG